MKKILFYTVVISMVFALLLTLVSGIINPRGSSNLCAGCHGNQYKEYCNLLPDDPSSSLPTSINMNEQKTVKMAVEVISTGSSGSMSYFLVDLLRVTLSSNNGYIDIASPQQEAQNIYPDDLVVFEWTITGLTGGDDLLSFSLYAHAPHMNCDTSDSFSRTVSVISDNTVPGMPLNVASTIGDGMVTISWSTPADDGGSPLTSYKLYRGEISGAEEYLATTSPGTLSYEDTTVTNGITYYYYVSALNSLGESPHSNEVSATPLGPPLPPQDLAGTSGDAFVHLSWVAPLEDGGSDITLFRLYRGETQGTKSLLETLEFDTFEYNDTSVSNDITYYYHITAENSIGESPSSDVVYLTPQKELTVPSSPRSLSAMSGDGFVNISWAAPLMNGGTPITGYDIFRRENSSEMNILVSVSPAVLRYNDTDVINNITYYYHVRATNLLGWSEPCDEVNGTPLVPIYLPDAPMHPFATVGDGYVVISWAPVAQDGNSPITNFSLYRGVNNLTFDLLVSLASTILEYNDTTVQNDIEYYYYITAFNSLGEGSPSDIVTASPKKRLVEDDGKVITFVPPIFEGVIPEQEYLNHELGEVIMFIIDTNESFVVSWLVDEDTYAGDTRLLTYPALEVGEFFITAVITDPLSDLSSWHNWTLLVSEKGSALDNEPAAPGQEAGSSGLFSAGVNFALLIGGGVLLLVLVIFLFIYYWRGRK